MESYKWLREEKEVWKECEDELYYDAISGELMIKELIEEARQVEMDTFKKYGVYGKTDKGVLGEDRQSPNWSEVGRH